MVGISILKAEWSIINHSCFIIRASKLAILTQLFKERKRVKVMELNISDAVFITPNINAKASRKQNINLQY